MPTDQAAFLEMRNITKSFPGVRALDVRGALGTCAATARDAIGRCDLALAGRVLGTALSASGAYVWGVDGASGSVIASDMLSGVWRLARAKRP